MAQLIEPDGTLNVKTSVDDAVHYCKTHPGWTWRMTEEDEERECIATEDPGLFKEGK